MEQVWVFVGVAFVLAITPGADTLLVIRSVLAAGRAAGLITNLGVSLGLMTHALFSALGLSLILAQSALAFELVKLLGGGYLIWLGIQSVWQARRGWSASSQANRVEKTAPRRSPQQYFWTGFLTNLLNPKVALFYLAFLPQFVEPGQGALGRSLLLGSIHLTFAFVWLIVVALLVGQLQPGLTHPRVKAALETFTGLALLGLGTRLLLERR